FLCFIGYRNVNGYAPEYALNSNYIRNIYEQNVKESGRVFPQVKLEKLKPLSIVIPTLEERKKIENLVTQIIDLKLNGKSGRLEELLNKTIDKLYEQT
uniref:restriction endonuclease subunit S n=1 Tax=uncultured Bacteroides sp. TaxID=162156 RepID=UPI0025911E71